MKNLSILVFAILLASCSSNTSSLCDCVEAGDAVNKISASLFDRTPTKEAADSLKQAEKIRDSICAPYQTMMPEELQEKAKECEALKFSTDN